MVSFGGQLSSGSRVVSYVARSEGSKFCNGADGDLLLQDNKLARMQHAQVIVVSVVGSSVSKAQNLQTTRHSVYILRGQRARH